MGVVIALSGAIGSRRSELAERLAEKLGWPKIKFSDYIRQQILAAGENAQDRLLLQQYGQRLVQNHLIAFVEGVLAMAPQNWQADGNLVVDGLRHVEVLLSLRSLVEQNGGHSKVFYVHVKPDPLGKEAGARDRGIMEQDMYRYDRALSEAQMNRILPAYADLEVDGALGSALNLQDIVEKLKSRGMVAA